METSVHHVGDRAEGRIQPCKDPVEVVLAELAHGAILLIVVTFHLSDVVALLCARVVEPNSGVTHGGGRGGLGSTMAGAGLQTPKLLQSLSFLRPNSRILT